MKEKLEIFCNKVKREQIPLKIEEIWGFGSFFRLKDNPKDIDLILKYSDRNPIYDKFKQILDKIISNHLDEDSPKESFQKRAKNELTEEEFEKFSPIFTQWMENYTWNTIFGGIMSIPEFQINENKITKRVLLQDLKGIQIFDIIPVKESLDKLRAENINLVWSTNHPNILTNLETILSPENVRLARINELKNFDKQISSHQIEYEIILVLVKHVRRLKNVENDFWDYRETLQKKTQNNFPNISEKILKQVIDNVRLAHPDEQIVPPSTKLQDYTNSKDYKIKELVEVRRSELKDIQKTLVVTRDILFHLYQHKHKIPDEWNKQFSQNELIAKDVISGIPKREVSDDKIRDILKALNFPEHRIFERMGRGRYRYVIPETKEEELKIIESNKKTEMIAKYHRILQPIIKQFNKDVYFSFNLDQDLKPINTNLYFYHSNYSKAEIPESVNKVIKFLKNRGFTIRHDKYGIDGEMIIQLEGCQTNKEMKDRVSSSLKQK